LIQAALNDNKSLYGFHFTGHYGYINPLGFLEMIEITKNKDGNDCYLDEEGET